MTWDVAVGRQMCRLLMDLIKEVVVLFVFFEGGTRELIDRVDKFRS